MSWISSSQTKVASPSQKTGKTGGQLKVCIMRYSFRLLCLQTSAFAVIVTEWMEGGTLEHVLATLCPGGCTEANAKLIIGQILRGLAVESLAYSFPTTFPYPASQHLHSRGIFHRDIKPPNVLAAYWKSFADLHLKIADFGVAGYIKNRLDRAVSGVLHGQAAINIS